MFAQSMHIKLALPKGAQLSIFLMGKAVVLHLCEGTGLQHTTDRIEKRIKSPADFTITIEGDAFFVSYCSSKYSQ